MHRSYSRNKNLFIKALLDIPNNADKGIATSILADSTTSNNFTIVTEKSENKKLGYTCKKRATCVAIYFEHTVKNRREIGQTAVEVTTDSFKH